MVKVSRVNISSMEVVQSSFDQHSVPRRKKKKKKRREKHPIQRKKEEEKAVPRKRRRKTSDPQKENKKLYLLIKRDLPIKQNRQTDNFSVAIFHINKTGQAVKRFLPKIKWNFHLLQRWKILRLLDNVVFLQRNVLLGNIFNRSSRNEVGD